MSELKALVIYSGGMDSTTLLYKLIDEGYLVMCLSFDYGQRHRKELECARILAGNVEVDWNLIDLTSITRLLPGNALTDTQVEVPEGHYADENMKLTVVHNRNAMMLSIAYGIASAMNCDVVATGVHAGDHPIYPDCRPEFVKVFYEMEKVALDGFCVSRLYTPFMDIGKHAIVDIGHALDVPYEKTWSCYKGGELHCGKCGTCIERKEAFELAQVFDPTAYEV